MIPDGGESNNYDDRANFKLTDAFTGAELITVNSTQPFEVRVNPSGIVMLIVERLSE